MVKKAAQNKGFESPDAIKRMQAMVDDMRKRSVVNKPVMLIYHSDAEDCIDQAIIFLRAGDNEHDARELAAEYGVKNPTRMAKVELPDNFDPDDVRWNAVYMG